MYFRDAVDAGAQRAPRLRIREMANPDEGEKEKAPEEANGFFGMATWWRMEELDGGVYLQNESGDR